MNFYLGTHLTNWLKLLDVPLFVSVRRLRVRKQMPRAKARWILDSGGFTELSMFGEWISTHADYIADTRRCAEEIGNLEYAAIRDWMCEPFVLQKTGLTVQDHQYRTISSFLDLSEDAPEIPWLPVLQGWTYDDYLRHVEMYYKARIYLHELPLVGIGSVCRRQHTAEAERIIRRIAREGIKLHGFGFKTMGLRRVSDALASADSLAWSFDARRAAPLAGCVGHINCANCLPYALGWRERLLGQLSTAPRRFEQIDLLEACGAPEMIGRMR